MTGVFASLQFIKQSWSKTKFLFPLPQLNWSWEEWAGLTYTVQVWPDSVCSLIITYEQAEESKIQNVFCINWSLFLVSKKGWFPLSLESSCLSSLCSHQEKHGHSHNSILLVFLPQETHSELLAQVKASGSRCPSWDLWLFQKMAQRKEVPGNQLYLGFIPWTENLDFNPGLWWLECSEIL